MKTILSAGDISASALSAERLRMEVVANNIANAYSTRSPAGGPFRRQQVVFASLLDQYPTAKSSSDAQLRGVRVVGVESDMTDFPQVYQPGHPDADESGFVRYPNIQVATEMVDLITANRAYEANLNALRAFRSLTEETLSLLKSVS